MTPPESLDARARARTEREAAGPADDVDQLLRQALKRHRIDLQVIDDDDCYGGNVDGVMVRAGPTIYVARRLSPETRRFVIAHELGHFHLHTDPKLELTTGAIADGGEAACAYSERERKESQATIFAREFLAPSDELREAYLQGRKPSATAASLGLPYDLVLRQTMRGVLRPGPPAATAALSRRPTLDRDQAEAAAWSGGHLLVTGAPASGKSATCAARIEHLLSPRPRGAGSSPASIAVLTQSEAAVRRLRSRIDPSLEASLVQGWFGTFKGFAHEIVSLHPSGLGLTPAFRVLDEVGALEVIEAAIDALAPKTPVTGDPVRILREIARRKEAMADPFADRPMSAKHEALLQDVRAVLPVFASLLAAADAIVSADLVPAAVRLLRSDARILGRTRSRFEHVVVDAFDEAGTADLVLLRTLAGAGTTIFAAGDPRGGLYRFRGARPDAMKRFPDDFEGGVKIHLRGTYRGPPSAKAAIAEFTSGIVSGSGRTTRRLAVSVAPDVDGEAEAIARRIEICRTRGTAYRDQVILSRSHRTLDRLAPLLESRGVPLAYLGDLAGRPEIQDLLALASIDVEAGMGGLEWVAALPIYGIASAATRRVGSYATAHGLTSFGTLSRLDAIDGISGFEKTKLRRLARDVEGFDGTTSSWEMLTTWLFERSGYVQTALGGADAAARSRSEAVGVLLGICDEQRHDGRGSLASRVKRVQSLNQDTDYRRNLRDEDGTDRVQMMTIHAAAGREFAVVHVPALANGYLPAPWKGGDAPLPGDAPPFDKAAHAEVEEALLATAMSRAREHVHLSRAENYAGSKAATSPFLVRMSVTAVERPSRIGVRGRGPAKPGGK